MDQTECFADRPLAFAIAAREARGRLVRLGPVLAEILSAHAYPPAVARVLAEALVLTALLGALLKDDAGQLTMQAQTEGGPIGLLVCDWHAGALRGYAQFDEDAVAALPADPTLFALFGKGYLAITFDQETASRGSGPDAARSRYQGIVPLEGGSLAEAAAHYFEQSEQIPTLIRVAIGQDAGGPVAAGILAQHLPEGEDGRERLHVRLDHPHWEHIRAFGETVGERELLDPALSLEAIIWRLFHEEAEVRVVKGPALSRGCRCDPVHIRDVLGRFPAAERAEMANDGGDIMVDCRFCSRLFALSLAGFDN